MRNHLTPQIINAGEAVERREPSYIVGGNANWYSHYGEQYGGSIKNKLKIELPYNPVNPTAGQISGEKHALKVYMHPNIHCSTIYNSQSIEAILMSIDREMETKDVVYRYNGILLSH